MSEIKQHKYFKNPLLVWQEFGIPLGSEVCILKIDDDYFRWRTNHSDFIWGSGLSIDMAKIIHYMQDKWLGPRLRWKSETDKHMIKWGMAGQLGIFVKCDSTGDVIKVPTKPLDSSLVPKLGEIMASRWLPIYGQLPVRQPPSVAPNWQQSVRSKTDDIFRDIFG